VCGVCVIVRLSVCVFLCACLFVCLFVCLSECLRVSVFVCVCACVFKCETGCSQNNVYLSLIIIINPKMSSNVYPDVFLCFYCTIFNTNSVVINKIRVNSPRIVPDLPDFVATSN
jgi:hypothetical protein